MMKGAIVISTNDRGGSRGDAKAMARYALDKGKNELSEIIDIRGTLAQDVPGAFAEMEAIAKGSRCTKFLYHYQINPAKGVELTREQWERAIEVSEKALGLDECQHVVFRHVKKGREHYHVVCNRVRENEKGQLRAVNMGNDARIRQAAAVQLEKEFGLDGLENRPLLTHERGERAPKGWEYKQAERTGIDPKQLKADIRTLQEKCADAREFAEALRENGFVLTKGDRRDFVLIDPAGGEHNLARLCGMKAADLREYMSSIDREKLPTVEQAKQAEREGVSYHLTPEAPHGKTAAKIFEAFQKSETGAELSAGLSGQGVYFARATAADVFGFQTAREAAKEAGSKRIMPTVKEGEFVAVDQYGNTFKLNRRTTGCTLKSIETKTADLKQSPLMSIREAVEVGRFAANAKAEEKKAEREAQREARHQEKIKADPGYNARMYEWLGRKEKEDKFGLPQTEIDKKEYKSVIKTTIHGVARCGEVAINTLEGVLDFLCGTPAPRHISPDEYRRDAKARREYHAQQAREARREKALKDIRLDYESGRSLELADIANLNSEDAQQIKAYGDDGIRMLIEQQERREKERHRGRERERS
jgi:hypothetical protein